MKNMIKAIFASVIFAAALSMVGCKDGREMKRPAGDSGYAVTMSFSLSSSGDADAFSPLEVSVVSGIDNVSLEAVAVGEEYSRSLECASLPSTVGFIVTPSSQEDISGSGEAHRLEYKVEWALTLTCDGEIVRSESGNETVELLFDGNTSEDDGHADAYLFYVVPDKIERVVYDDTVDDDNLYHTGDCPENDEDKVKAIGVLHFASEADDAEEESCLHDNLIARFTTRDVWRSEKLGRGDYLYVKGNELNDVDQVALKESIGNGAVVILDEVDDYATLDRFCRDMGIYNPLSDDGSDMSHSLFILGASDIPFFSSENNSKYHGLFFKVSPMTADGGFVSDFSQGEIIDRTVEVLNDISGTSVGEYAASRSGSYDLTTLVSATKLLICDDGCLQTLRKRDYRGDYADESQSNIYNVEADIWHVKSGGRNYYYIHQEFMGSFSQCYKGIHSPCVTTNGCHTKAKVCEWYGDNVTITAVPDNSAGMQIHRNSPASTNTSTTYTSGLQWNLSGEVSYSNGAGWGETVYEGISLSSSQLYFKKDVTVVNNCVPGQKLSWSFEMRSARASFSPIRVAGTNMYGGAMVGQSSLRTGMDYVISFPETTSEPTLKLSLEVNLRSTCAKAGSICGVRNDKKSYSRNIKLPVLRNNTY